MLKKRPDIQVIGNSPYSATPKPNKSLDNPKTGTPIFGFFPEIKASRVSFEEGPIYLRYGVHHGPNRGFGLVHIWEEHLKREVSAMAALPRAADLILAILQKQATIHYEYEMGKAADRTAVLKSNSGMVILERRQDGLNNVYYSIVTAFPGKKAHGQLIGKIEKGVLDP